MATDKPYMDIELFPCAGGMGEGFRRSGVTFDLMIEIAQNHCDSYEQNLGHRPVQMDARDFYRMVKAGWKPPKPIRLLVADPPCTPWSRAGKRLGQTDPRDMLDGTCQIISELRPQVYLIGNVPGLDDAPNLPIVQRVIGGLSDYGYCTADFARLDAANYGVPQHRVRPFWFGHRRGPCILWPEPTHCDPDELLHPTLPGVARLLPWITCAQALSHLTLEEAGRPIKLRQRGQNSKQHGSVAERPARVVGTSNLSDGNVLLTSEAPRAGKRGPRERDRHRVPQANRVGDPNKPAATMTSKPARKGAGAHSTIAMPEHVSITFRQGDHEMSRADHPARTLTQNTHSDGAIILNGKHMPSQPSQPSQTIAAVQRSQGGNIIATPSMKHRAPAVDEPANTLRGGGNGHSPPALVITAPNHKASSADVPAKTVLAGDGGGSRRAMEWPWERPSTTVLADERLAPPGHHDDAYAVMSTDGDGIVISERAGTILQGFPETWVFVGDTKKARWSQLGQAMPPPLAHAVATSVVIQIKRTDDGQT